MAAVSPHVISAVGCFVVKSTQVIISSVENLKTKQSQNSAREARRKIKEQYGSLYNQVAEILYRHDPIYLAACDAPTDEYGGEARTGLINKHEVK